MMGIAGTVAFLLQVLDQARFEPFLGSARKFMVPISNYQFLLPPEGVQRSGGFRVIIEAQMKDEG